VQRIVDKHNGQIWKIYLNTLIYSGTMAGGNPGVNPLIQEKPFAINNGMKSTNRIILFILL
jgi:hypothetical protein